MQDDMAAGSTVGVTTITRIDNALCNLQGEVGRFNSFIEELRNGPIPKCPISEVATLPFTEIYNSISERVDGAAKQVSENIETLRAMLL